MASHPAGNDGVDVAGVVGAQGHEVCVERPDSLKPQSDVAGRTEVKEVRGQVVGPRAAIDEGGVNLYEAVGGRQDVRQVGKTTRQTDRSQNEIDRQASRLTSPCSSGLSLE